MAAYYESILGKYDTIEVKANNSVAHEGKDISVNWINKYAFYFEFSPGNEQIWIYDTVKNCLYQMCNTIEPGFLTKRCRPKTGLKEVYFDVDRECLGNFGAVTIYDNAWLNKAGEIRPIAWINPMSFYTKGADNIEQVWVCEASKNTYLQLPTVGDKVCYDAFHHNKNTFSRP